MKIFAAVTLVVFLCCLEVALCYHSWAAARPRGRPQEIAGRPRGISVESEESVSHNEQTANTQGCTLLMVHLYCHLLQTFLPCSVRFFCIYDSDVCFGINGESVKECIDNGGRSVHDYHPFCGSICISLE